MSFLGHQWLFAFGVHKCLLEMPASESQHKEIMVNVADGTGVMMMRLNASRF